MSIMMSYSRQSKDKKHSKGNKLILGLYTRIQGTLTEFKVLVGLSEGAFYEVFFF